MDRDFGMAAPSKGLFDASARLRVLAVLLILVVALPGAVNCAPSSSGSSLAANFDGRRLQMISMPKLWSGLTSDEVICSMNNVFPLPRMNAPLDGMRAYLLKHDRFPLPRGVLEPFWVIGAAP